MSAERLDLRVAVWSRSPTDQLLKMPHD